MARNRDIERFKRDAKSFGRSAIGNIPHVGEALGIYDTVQSGRRLAQSTPRAVRAVNRSVKSSIYRRVSRYL